MQFDQEILGVGSENVAHVIKSLHSIATGKSLGTVHDLCRNGITLLLKAQK